MMQEYQIINNIIISNITLPILQGSLQALVYGQSIQSLSLMEASISRLLENQLVVLDIKLECNLRFVLSSKARNQISQ